MPEPATNHPKNKELRLHLASALYFLSRVAVAGFVFAVPAVYFIRGHVEMPVVLGGAALVTLLFVAYYLAASGLRCAACSNPVLMDNGTRKHPHARRIPGLSHRARAAWDILFKTNYQCMYCNTRCRCKKSWSSTAGTGVPSGRPVAAAAQAKAGNSFPESVFSSVFGGVDLEPQRKTSPVGRFPGAEEEEESIFSEPKPATGRVVAPSSKTESIFPDARTAPVAVEPEPPIRTSAADREKKEETAPVPVLSTMDETRAPLPWEMPPPRRASAAPAPAPVEPKAATAPQPAAVSETSDFTQDTPAMNNHAPERTAAPLPSNPFLAAAAAQPPPPGPLLPVRPSRQPAAETSAAPAFPPAGAPEPADGPPPWTLPSVPRPSAPPAITAPVLPIIPDTAASLARRPQMSTSPVPVPPPSAFGSPHPSTAPVSAPPPPLGALPSAMTTAAMPPSAAPALPVSLIKDVVGVLEEGQRSLTSAFQSIIEKLESRLTASAAAAPVQLPQPPVAVVPPPAPVPLPAAPALPPLVAAAPAPVADAPVPAPAPRRMPEPPALEIPAAPAMPAPVAPAPAAPVYESEAPAPPARRRFARPSGVAAQSLSDAINGAFGEAPAAPAPAPVPYTNGHAPHAAAPLPPIESPFAFAQPPAAAPAPAPAPRQAAFNPSAFSPAGLESPFALADETLTEATAPHVPQPAPFTFLKPQGDHFAPVNSNGAPAAAPAPAAYDALEDTPLPWMQPVGGRR